MDFANVRRVVVFALGVVVILEAVAGSGGDSIAELLVGAVLVGVLPLDDFLNMLHDWRTRDQRRHHHRNHDESNQETDE